jgi:FMN-dependent NADH-azoreductase
MQKTTQKTQRVLRIDASSRGEDSVTRQLADRLVDRLREDAFLELTHRNTADGLPFVDADWIGANFTEPEVRTAAQRAALAVSDALVAELKQADVLILAVPIYNFGVPASFKAWVDLVARARETFRYTENGPVGLLVDKKAYVIVASGGTEVGSAIDFATPYLRHVLGFLGIQDVEVISAGQGMVRGEEAVLGAREAIRALAV